MNDTTRLTDYVMAYREQMARAYYLGFVLVSGRALVRVHR